MSKLIELTGQRFGRLVVLERNGSYRCDEFSSSACWLCRCDCGNTKTIRGINLITGATKSCGCLRNEKGVDNLKKARAAKKKKG